MDNDLKNKYDLTISFSGYNIKTYLQLAIKSLLYFHPEVKECIVVFDDNSTDGTKEWLKEYGIKRITWSGKYDDIIRDYDKKYPNYGVCLSYYNNIMVREIMEQTSTKYLMINDGDVVFFNKFLNTFFEKIKIYKGLFILGGYESIMLNDNRYDQYNLLYKNGMLHRVHLYNSFFDLDYFKEIDLLFDDIYDELYIDALTKHVVYIKEKDIYSMYADGGINFLYQLYSKNINFYTICHSSLKKSDYIYHFGWRSSFEKQKIIHNTNYINEFIDEKTFKEMESNIRLNFIIKLLTTT